MKKNKLSIEKFRIIKLTNLSNIRGGTGHGGSAEMPLSDNSQGTTYTTDPGEPCPTANDENTNNSIPTLPPPK